MMMRWMNFLRMNQSIKFTIELKKRHLMILRTIMETISPGCTDTPASTAATAATADQQTTAAPAKHKAAPVLTVASNVPVTVS